MANPATLMGSEIITDDQVEAPVDAPYEETPEGEDKPKKAKTPNDAVQARMRTTVQETFIAYADVLKPYRDRLIEVYESYATYKSQRSRDYETNFKINKAHEVVEKVVPRIVAKDPRWLVSPRMDDFYPDQPLTDEQGQPLTDPHTIPNTPENQQQLIDVTKAWVVAKNKRFEQTMMFCDVVQDYLTYIFDEYGLRKYLRRWGKNMVTYGKGIAKICYKYEVWGLGRKSDGEGYEEGVRGEYPAIEIKSWSDVYWDPRYLSFRDSPAILETATGVRYWDIVRKKDTYFNLDKLEQVVGCTVDGENMDDYKKKIASIAGLKDVMLENPVEKNALTLTYFYGYFAETDDSEEQMCEICVVGYGTQLLFPICYKPISRMPFVEIDCFEDPEVNQPVGFVEPIMSLVDEMNFKKNAASQYINRSLYRSYLWSPQSGIDPRDLEDRPSGIITVPDSVQEAKANFEEIAHRELNPAYFQEQNDLDRQIQSQSFTVDTSSQRGQQALTDTATGVRVAFFESNSVINEVRKHFEEGVAMLGYQLLIETFENMDENIVFKKMGTEGFWEINKELLRDAIMRYTIKIEANSSSFDDVESRRNEAMGFWNFANAGAKAGVGVDLNESWKEAALTWEKKDPNRFMKPQSVDQVVQEMLGIQPPAADGGGGNVPVPPGAQTPAGLTQQVASGDIVTAQQQ